MQELHFVTVLDEKVQLPDLELLTTRMVGDCQTYDMFGCPLKFAKGEDVLKRGAGVVKTVVQMTV